MPAHAATQRPLSPRVLLRGCLFIALLSLNLVAETPSSRTEILMDLMRTDAEFSSLGAREGLARAFSEFAAPQGLLLSTGARGPAEIAGVFRPLDAGGNYRLHWAAVWAEGSAAGDLGCTLGVWDMENKTPEAKPIRKTGMYVTVWGKAGNTPWRYLADGGAGALNLDTINALLASLRQRPSPAPVPPPTGSDTTVSSGFEKTLSVLYGAAMADERKLFARSLADDVILFPSGSRGRQSFDPNSKLRSWEPLLAQCSSSGDLGYCLGLWREDGVPQGQGLFLHLWKRHADGSWKLQLTTESELKPETLKALMERWTRN